jgi:hypothetical protein
MIDGFESCQLPLFGGCGFYVCVVCF